LEERTRREELEQKNSEMLDEINSNMKVIEHN
jgi:hypothetical protein